MGTDPTLDPADPLAVTQAGSGDDASASGSHRILGASARIGRYVVRGTLGAGGMGVVYGAYDPDLDRPVAIKLLRPELNTSRARLVREGQAIAKLHHPNLITVHDIGIHEHDVFIAMELVRGETLGAWMRAAPGKRRPWRDALAKLIPAGRGLAAAHAAGLVHRDFKPENVLLGEGDRVVVTDFGLAQLGDTGDSAGGDAPALAHGSVDELHLTKTGAVLGTPAYMSPEQFRGERPDARSDQFSFCVTLYEALHGSRPFEGEHASITTLSSSVTDGRIVNPLARDLPRWLRRALARGLRPDPAARWPSMDALLDALRPPRRARIAIAAIAGIAALGAAVAAILATRDDGAPVGAAVAACDAAGAELDAVWNDDTRALYRARLAGRGWLDQEVGWLDAYARQWSARRRRACVAGGAAQPADPCLRAAADALAAAIARTNEEWPELPALAACDRAPPRTIEFPIAIGLGPQGVAQLSADGQRIVISNLAEPPSTIAADPAVFAPAPVAGASLVGDWLADGRVVAQLPDGSLAVGPADGSAWSPLPGKGDLLHTQINIASPDGARLAIQEDDAIVVVAAADGARLHVVAGPAHEVAWEPGGRRLAIVSRDLYQLKLLDTRTGEVVSSQIRLHSRGLGEIGVAWLAPGRLAMSGSADAGGTFGVFELRLDDRSHLIGAPALRWRAPDATMVRLFDAGGGRVLLESATSRQRMFRWHDGKNLELPSAFVGLRLSAIDRARGEALAFGPGQLVRFDVDKLTRTVTPGKGHTLPALHDGAAVQVASQGPNSWTLVELAADGSSKERVRFAWPAEHGAPHVRCSPLDTTRCVLASRDGRALHVTPLGERGPGTPLVIAEPSWNPDVSKDGRRVLVPTVPGDLLSVELATGDATKIARIEPTCRMRTVRWIDDGPRAWVVLLCPDRFAIGSVGPGEPFAEVVRSDGWISGVEALAGGAFLYTVMDWDPQLVVIEGL